MALQGPSWAAARAQMMDAAFQEKPDDRADDLRAALARIAALEQAVAELAEMVRVMSAPRRTRRSGDEDLPENGGWVTLKEAAYRARRSPAWLYAKRRRGAIPEIATSSGILVKLSAVRAAIAVPSRTLEDLPVLPHNGQHRSSIAPRC